MDLGSFLLLLLVAAIIGVLGEALGGYSPGGLAASIIVGFIGAYIGQWLKASLHMGDLLTVRVAGHPFAVVWSVIGAALFVTLLRLIMSRRTYVVR